MHIPIFVEVLNSENNADLQICRKIMRHLFRKNIAPLPFASGIQELTQAVHNLKQKNLAPGVFVINTFWAEELLRDLDAVVGDVPIVLLNRRMFAGKSGSQTPAVQPLQDLDTRPAVICQYGPKDSDTIAEMVSKALVQFCNDGAFWHVETLAGMSSLRLKAQE